MTKKQNIKTIEVSDWDNLVRETYGRDYNFQQQNNARNYGNYKLTIPPNYTNNDEMNTEIPEIINGNIIGVKFKSWLKRDPKQAITNQKYEWELNYFWERSFYPCVYEVANDLYKKGLIKAGEYKINID